MGSPRSSRPATTAGSHSVNRAISRVSRSSQSAHPSRSASLCAIAGPPLPYSRSSVMTLTTVSSSSEASLYSTATPAPPPGSFFFRTKETHNMTAAQPARNQYVSMYARVSA